MGPCFKTGIDPKPFNLKEKRYDAPTNLRSADCRLDPCHAKQTALTEAGAVVPARPDPVNKHDMLTGSQPDGTAFPPGRDMTCSDWSSSDQGSAMLGHHNRDGTNPDPIANVSWNSSHGSAGCSMPALVRTGGAGLFYCFATK